MSQMFKPVQLLLENLRADGREFLNKDVFEHYGEREALAVWTEGGEWPAYDDAYSNYDPGPRIRELDDVEYVNPNRAAAAMQTVRSQLEDDGVAAISLDCGSGKSTILMETVVREKLARRVFSVQPSLATAAGLAKYVGQRTTCVYARDFEEANVKRGLVYTNAGVMLQMLARGIVDDHTDLVVVDESHSPTFVHHIVLDMLSRVHVPVLLMTASTVPRVVAPRGVKCEAVEQCTPKVSEALSGRGAIAVGVMANGDYVVPASALVGATVNGLRVVYDTGLRPDPRIDKGVMHYGERRAQAIELLQTAGRLGRTGQSGTYYYVAEAPVEPSRGLSVYDVLERAFKSVLKLEDKGLHVDKARAAWQSSGVLRASAPPVSVTRVSRGRGASVLSPSSEKSPPPVYEKEVAGRRSLSSVRSGRSRHSSASSVRSGPLDFAGLDQQFEGSLKLVEGGDDVSVQSGGTDRQAYVVRRQADSLAVPSQLSDGDFRVRYEVKRERVKPYWAFGKSHHETTMRVAAYDHSGKRLRGEISDWRPFVRADRLDDTDVKGVGMELFVQALLQAHAAGDWIKMPELTMLNEGAVSPVDTDDARAVLAQKLPASFSETEVMAVCKEWNKLTRSYGGRKVNNTLLTPFVDYFGRLITWNYSLREE